MDKRDCLHFQVTPHDEDNSLVVNRYLDFAGRLVQNDI